MLEQVEAKDQNIDPILLLQSKEIDKNLPLKTEQSKLQAYLQFLSIDSAEKFNTIGKSLIKILPQEEIQYDQSIEFVKKVIVKITKSTKNLELIDVEARFGYFIFKKISLINIEGVSSTHKIANNDSGNFCTVYLCKHKENNLAFKCFSKSKLLYLLKEGNILERVIQEYCILKLASIMKVGPKMSNMYGFDIMIYQKCIEFCMEGCQPFPQGYMSIIHKIEEELKQNLVILHSSKIIHHDIKMENISFSKAFNKFVFIDFGMGRILQQNVGFKSLSSFKGSLNHCSDQMVALNRQNSNIEKPIDLYFNDMTALKITFEQLRKEEFQYDIKLISKQRRLKLIQNANQIHNFNFIKYNLFNVRTQAFFRMVTKLKRNQRNKILRWFINLKVSPKLKKIYNRLLYYIKSQQKKSFQYPQNNEQVQQKVSESLQVQTLRQLNEINRYSIVSYFSNQFNKNFNELFNFLKNQEKILAVKLQEYQCLLAKAIQINASYLSMQQIQDLCKSYEQRYPLQQKSLKQNTKQSDTHFLRISQFLFKKAFQNKLKGKYLNIFISTINNVILYQLLNQLEIVNYLQIILASDLNFQTKIKILIIILSSFYWFYFTSFALNKYFLIMKVINQKANLWVQNFTYNEAQVQTLKAILFKKYVYGHRLGQNQNQRQKENIPQVKIWLVCNKINSLSFDKETFQDLQELVFEISSISSSSFFQYYHFFLMFVYILDRNESKLQQLIHKAEKSLRNKQKTPWLMLIKSINVLIQNGQKNIQKFIKEMVLFKQCQHSLMNYAIFYFLRQIIVHQLDGIRTNTYLINQKNIF